MELVEREELLAQLDGYLDEARSGAGRLALVGGEAGVGKTSLIRAFADAVPGGVRVLWGSCDPFSTPRPLGPFHDMEPLMELLDRPSGRHELLTSLLSELKHQTVMVVDDAHWADEATLDAIRFLGRRIETSGSVVVVTYRDDEVGHAHPLRAVLGDLATAGGYRRLKVPPLTEGGVEALASGKALDAQRLHRITGGNPFYVTEVLAAPGWTVPATVSDAVLARVSRLSPQARDLLEIVALAPGGLEPEIVEELFLDAPRARDESTEHGVLVRSGGVLAFRHELARLAMEDAIPAGTRRDLHRRLLDTLEDLPHVEPARLAHHADAAGDAGRVLHYAPLAARVSSDRGAHREAASQYERAVSYAARLPPAELADLLSTWADERYKFDDPSEIAALRTRSVELRRRTGDRIAEGVELRKLARALASAGGHADAERTATQAVQVLEEAGDGPELAHAYAQLGYIAEIGYRPKDALTWTSKAIELAARFEAREALSLALQTQGEVDIIFHEELRGVAAFEESGRLALAAGDDDSVASALINLGASLMVVRRYAAALASLEEALAFAGERDLDHYVAFAKAYIAWLLLGRGEWEAAERNSAEALATDQPRALVPVMALAVRGRLFARRGDPDASETVLAAWDAAHAADVPSHLWPAVVGRLEEAWLDGRQDEITKLAPAALTALAQIRVPWVESELAFWLWRTGVIERPTEGVGPFALQMSGAWREAAEAWERIGCPYEQADALADGDEPALRRALAIFTSLGARPAADRVREALRRVGATRIPARPRASTRSAPYQLTRRQLEVLALVEAGLSNAEIATRLFITEKTVGHHVSAVLRKLGVRSRAEAGAAARKMGIRDPNVGNPPDDGGAPPP